MGDYMFQLGDLVTRKSYDNDIVFKIVSIREDNYILKGVFVRLFADSPKDDLKIYGETEEDDFTPEIEGYRSLERNEYFYLPGRILHIDSDILLSNDLLNPYKIRKKAKIQKYINHQKKQKMSKI